MIDSENILQGFISYLKRKGRSKSTIIAYSKDLEQLSHYNTKKSLKEFTSEDIKKFLDFLKIQNNLTGKSISRKLNSIRTFYKYLVSKNEISTNPSLNVIHPKFIQKKPRILNSMEILALREISRENKRLFMMIELLMQTGIRISELSQIKIKNINLKSKSISIGAPSGEKRIVPINDKLAKEINEYINSQKKVAENSYLFSTRTGKNIEIRNIRSSIDRAILKAKIKNLCVNDIRNTFIVFQLESGISLSRLAEIVGHKNIVTTQKYLPLLAKKYSPKGVDILVEL